MNEYSLERSSGRIPNPWGNLHKRKLCIYNKDLKLKYGIREKECKREERLLPWLPGNLFDLGRVDDGASGTRVGAPHLMAFRDQQKE